MNTPSYNVLLNKEKLIRTVQDLCEEANKTSASVNDEQQRAEGVEGDLNTRLETVEELATISVGGGDIGIATAADFDNPDAEARAKVPTVGAIYDSIDDFAVYDISAHNNGATYADLAAALGTNGANVPVNIRKGGMSVQYVNSSDNKYVRFNYLLSSITDANIANVNNWVGVDIKPKYFSKNIVESGGVADAIKDLWAICDKTAITSENVAGQINSDGSITTPGNNWNFSKFPIEGGKKYIIYTNVQHVGTFYSYALYSSSELSSSTCIEVGQKATALEYTDNYFIIEAPSNAAYIAIQRYKTSVAKLYEVSGVIDSSKLKSDITSLQNEFSGDIDKLLSAVFSYENAVKDSALTTEYAENFISDVGGSLSTYSSYSPDIYQLSAGDRIKIKVFYKYYSSGPNTYPCYGLYSATPFGSSTCIKTGEKFGKITNGEEFILEIEEDCYLFAQRNNNVPCYCSVEVLSDESKITQLEDEIDEINEQIIITEEEIITEWDSISNTYINGNGNLATYNNYRLDYFQVTPGETYKISIKNGVGEGRLYAVYSSSEFSSSTVILPIGNKMNNSSGTFEQTVTIPTDGQYLALGFYSSPTAQNVKRTVKKMSHQSISEKINELMENVVVGNIAVTLSSDGNNLYAAYLMDDGTEITYWFKKCMANQLFTFYRVGYRTVTRKYPSTEAINNEDGTIINATASDNIGPLSMSNGGWVGGNHHYPGEDATPKYLTAQTDNYYCYADGKLLSAGDNVYCNTLSIKVVNTIFDPAVAPSVGDTKLSTPLSTETVLYTIKKNTIEVSLRQAFVGTTTNSVSKYWGMQSMFQAESGIMTPLGSYTDWTEPANISDFTKSGYPNFNRFIEKSATRQSYQATYLYPVKMGTHGLIGGSDAIFKYNSGKCYHHVMQSVGNATIKGNSFIWSGGYTFFHNPILDNNDALVYSGTINGQDAIFIAAKQLCSIDIELPQDFLMRKINVIEQQGVTTTDTATDVSGVHIDAIGAGSLIFTLE